MEDKIDEILEKVTKIKDFIDNEAQAIENEVNANVKDTLAMMYPEYTIINVLEELADIKIFFEPNSNDKITEFDGLFVATDDPSYKIDAKESSIVPKAHNRQTFFVIVESKHTTTINKVNSKIEQITKIQRAFEMAREIADGTSSASSVTKSFMWRLRTYQIHNFEPEVHLLLGGPYITDSAKKYVEQIGETLWKTPKPIQVSKNKYIDVRSPIRISMVIPTGQRYSVRDVASAFELRKIVMLGGGKKDKKIKKVMRKSAH